MRLTVEVPLSRWTPLDVRLRRGKGAGYVGGWTAFLSIGCHSPARHGYRIRRLQVGVTRNGNLTPTFPWGVYVHTRQWRVGR